MEVAFGIAFNNMGLGMAVGVAIGATGIFYNKKRKS